MEDRSRHAIASEAHVWSPTGNGPEYLKDVAIPPMCSQRPRLMSRVIGPLRIR